MFYSSGPFPQGKWATVDSAPKQPQDTLGKLSSQLGRG